MRKIAFVTLTVLLIAVGLSICEARPGPLIEELRDLSPRIPVIFIPGVTGSKLRDKTTGKMIWGKAGNLFGPRDGGRALAVPLVDRPAPGEVIEAFEIIERMTLLGVIRVKVYGPLIDALVHNGYVRGNLLEPRPEDTALVYPYDWRYGNLEATRQLPELLENLRRVRGEETLRVIFICHSNAARIARWFVKYGGASLEEAEAGRVGHPANVIVEKIIFVATGQGGALATLEVIDRGRTYVPLGRKLRPEYMFTLAGLFEALPAYQDDLFLDEDGKTLPVDLFDAADWMRHGWSLYGVKAQQRVGRLDEDDAVLGNEDDRLAWVASRLEITMRIQTMLMRDVPDLGPTRYYQVQGATMPTPSKAILVEDDKLGWRTLTIFDKRVRRNADLAAAAATPGDRHATRESQDWLSPGERDAVAGADYSIDAVHRSLFTSEAARRRILEFLLD